MTIPNPRPSKGIRLVTSHVVHPTTPRPFSSIKLTGQDLSMAKIYMHMHYLFPPPPASSASYTLSELEADVQTALGRTLDVFPHVAGSIHLRDGAWTLLDSQKGLRLDIAEACEKAGSLEPQDVGQWWDQDVAVRNPFVNDEDHLVAFKVTRYACGSVSITTSVHHWLMDFASYFDLLSVFTSFLSCTTPFAVDRHFERDVSSLFLPPLPSPAVSEEDTEVQAWFRPSCTPANFARPIDHTHVTPILFTATQLSSLKSVLLASSPTAGGGFSTMDALHALLWHVISDARSLAPNTPTSLLVTMDGRRRVSNSAFAARYFGNVHPGIAYRSDSSAIAQLAASASALRAGYLEAITPETMRRIVSYQQCHLDAVATNVDAMFANDVVISNLSGYEYDGWSWGRLGKVKAVTMLGSKGVEYGAFAIDGADGTVTVLGVPKTEGEEGEGEKEKRKDVIAYVGLRWQERERLLANALVAKWGSVLL
ncbi:hypothetical protein ACQY0O_000682 [Thecaphora frezii]